ncbi:hypothetical protein [Niabella ginsengisoli]|uniref:Uncharacterized protein n=1 Tax=Niabella ginsengisoli TaxID=522298 RepID=A0ABS9SPS3_9BACT|nr:hypothetical protein [Niabella ginsengisoli]MCH5600413.1 hypothetical protein [Niabella ginsengisoli]
MFTESQISDIENASLAEAIEMVLNQFPTETVFHFFRSGRSGAYARNCPKQFTGKNFHTRYRPVVL